MPRAVSGPQSLASDRLGAASQGQQPTPIEARREDPEFILEHHQSRRLALLSQTTAQERLRKTQGSDDDSSNKMERLSHPPCLDLQDVLAQETASRLESCSSESGLPSAGREVPPQESGPQPTSTKARLAFRKSTSKASSW